MKKTPRPATAQEAGRQLIEAALRLQKAGKEITEAITQATEALDTVAAAVLSSIKHEKTQ